MKLSKQIIELFIQYTPTGKQTGRVTDSWGDKSSNIQKLLPYQNTRELAAVLILMFFPTSCKLIAGQAGEQLLQQATFYLPTVLAANALLTHISSSKCNQCCMSHVQRRQYSWWWWWWQLRRRRRHYHLVLVVVLVFAVYWHLSGGIK